MANEDSFINEVTEEVRRDRLYRLMRRYGWIAVLAVIVIVGGATWNEWRKAQARAIAEAKGDALITALQAESAEARSTALNAIETTDDPSAQAILGLLQSAAALEADDADTAAAALDAVAQNADAPQMYSDVALLKRVMSAGAGLSADDKITRLEPLLAAGNPFRLLAVEQRAFAEVEKGDTEAALASLQSILVDAEVTEDLRRRAQQLIVALGGSVEPS